MRCLDKSCLNERATVASSHMANAARIRQCTEPHDTLRAYFVRIDKQRQ